jgi:hypothetical protein
MRIAAIAGLALLMTAAAEAQAPVLVNLPGDFDGDGKPDRVERNVAKNGAWRIWVWLGSTPQHALGVYEGDDPGLAVEPIEVKPPGAYKVLYKGETKVMTFPHDVILTLRMPRGRSLTFVENGLLNSAYLVD